MVGEQALEEAVLAERGLEQEQRRVAVAQDVVALGSARKRVERHHHSADARHGVGGDDPLGRVRDPDRDASALHHTRADQRARELAHARLDLGRHRVEQRVGDVAALREQLAPGLHSAGRFVEIEADHAPQLRQRGHAEPAGAPARDLPMVPEQILDEAVLGERGLQQEQRRIAVAQDVVPLGGARERVQRHGHAADAADCIRRDDPLRPVRHPDRHARALHHAGADQSPRELAHLLF